MNENMNEEYDFVDVETIDIPLEDDTVVTCAILDDFEIDGKKYYAMAPIDEDDVIGDDVWFYNYEEDGEDVILNYIDDEEELKLVIAAYEDYLEEDEDLEEEDEE